MKTVMLSTHSPSS